MIISVGYRVKSQNGVKFRQWATKVLKSYIQDGYVINTHKITEQRLLNLENDMNVIKSKIKNNELEIKQDIQTTFYINSLSKQLKLDIEKYNQQYNIVVQMKINVYNVNI